MGMFDGCTSLSKVHISSFPIADFEMFQDCSSLQHIYAYGLEAAGDPGTSSVYNGPFNNIRPYGTLHIKEGAVGYQSAPWTTLYDVYY